jgi:hypothetical protein
MSVKYELAEIQELFKSVGCILLSEEYIDANKPLSYKCSCGEVHSTRWSNFNKGIRHARCKDGQHHRLSKIRFQYRKYDLETVRLMMAAQKLELLEYNGLGRKIYLKCECGTNFYKTIEDTTIFNIHLCPNCIKEIGIKSRYNKHTGWQYSRWSEAVKHKDGYICQKCGSTDRDFLQSHHIKSWKEHIELRYDITNGITYCKDCHKQIHWIL